MASSRYFSAGYCVGSKYPLCAKFLKIDDLDKHVDEEKDMLIFKASSKFTYPVGWIVEIEMIEEGRYKNPKVIDTGSNSTYEALYNKYELESVAAKEDANLMRLKKSVTINRFENMTIKELRAELVKAPYLKASIRRFLMTSL